MHPARAQGRLTSAWRWAARAGAHVVSEHAREDAVPRGAQLGEEARVGAAHRGGDLAERRVCDSTAMVTVVVVVS